MTPQASAGRPWRCRAALAAAAVAGLALAGCASRQPSAPPQPDAAPPVREAPVEGASAKALSEFAARQRDAAERAERAGQWAEAARAWDVLLALDPEAAEPRARQGQARQAAQAGALDALEKARQARARNDSESANRLYLQALALEPSAAASAEAAEGLRALERDRVKRQHLGQLSRNTLLRRTPGDGIAAYTAGGAAPVYAAERNALEHASLLAGQGELEGAIALLKPLVQKRRPDPAARRLLADLYYRRAEGLATVDPDGAIAALEQCLRNDPAHPKAAARIKELRASRAAQGTKAIPKQPPRTQSP